MWEHWRRHQACSSGHSHRPSSPHQRCSLCHFSHIPTGRLSHPAELERAGWQHHHFFWGPETVFAPTMRVIIFIYILDRSQCRPAKSLHTSYCCPVGYRRYEEHCIALEKSGKHELSTAGCYDSLKSEKWKINAKNSVVWETLMRMKALKQYKICSDLQYSSCFHFLWK